MSLSSMQGDLSALQGLLTGSVSSMLIVGDIARWETEGREVNSSDQYVFARFADLDQALLAKTNPEIVLSPLIADDFDAFELVAKLKVLQYKGPYRAISSPLLNLTLVRDELRRNAPSLDFDIIEMP